ncbi:adenosylcobalamin-dependent ribonucleoside-diphosphate reductase [Cereibacter sphaeroides]|uniref:adenosylcobalamin-dependent ribonucleoside-diphosphate reductase n=1 Tax=Cereibacter sphaeroides TaxID=1063 RepID=UPI001F23B93E|nr:adenosylcobalamin-dependent ribonucleoside-diphosphate reductase [Cereibacter sphaeroides]MCE6958349.1 adenosylcobalamin-dependent ribonucleoside-diphosphate reductase [Cereibacter sphaeroides]MCE6972216.1 adenosylcobalamin-dependent ribonucleoside-diphosphate reductase [Cereibacter sphaeroides]
MPDQSPADPFAASISREIWDMKYRFKGAQTRGPEGEVEPLVHDATVEDTWRRIAVSLAEAEKPDLRKKIAKKFEKALVDFRFLPAGRITAGAGTGRNVTLFNCLHGDTPVLTLESGLVPLREVAGKIVHVVDGHGRWTQAMVYDHGVQDLVEVELAAGSSRKNRRKIQATLGHRWELDDGRIVTTEQLAPGDTIPVTYAKKEIADKAEYTRGIAHGIVYGDGSAECVNDRTIGYRVRLCDEKAELLPFLVAAGFSVSSPPSFGEDPLARIPHPQVWQDLKGLPLGTSRDYLLGFMRGWFATDGCVGARDGYPILSCDAAGVDFVHRWGPVAGFFPKKATPLDGETNLDLRKTPIWNVAIANWALEEADFLRARHRANRTVASYDWRVMAITPVMADRVFCPDVPTTGSFVIGDAILTKNCFVMGTIPDSMPGIFDALKDAALTMQQGGGIGYDFSTIRPRGAPVVGVGSDASGPLSFMDVWDAMCRTIMSAGSRRGAMMATMRCDHPDIESFITVKRDRNRLRNFNLSVLVTDAFMEAVKADASWDLVWKGKVWKTLPARELWDLIMKNTYDAAEPGVIFIDRINQRNPLAYIEEIASTNPCGEQPLPPYGACLLGSINLARLVKDAFQPEASLDVAALEELVATAVRMLDNTIDISNFPLEQQRAEAHAKRRIGLGVTGLADALLMLRLTYGSDAAVAQTREWMKAIHHAACRASVALAKEKGAFPLFDAEKYMASPMIQALDADLQAEIRAHGIRNALVTSIAPTGTISLYAGNVSSGIEPVFAYAYTRKVLLPDGSRTEQEVVDYAVKLYRETFGLTAQDALPHWFVSAQTLSPLAHVRMQAAAQEWVDSSISKTVNCPADIGFEEFKEIYMAAFDLGCKGCTTYRPNEVTGSILEVVDAKKDEEKAPEPVVPAVRSLAQPMPREEALPGYTYKLKWEDSSYYLTINDIIDEEGIRRPFEVFINTMNVEHQAWMVALTRMISAVFRRGGDVSFVAEELQGVFDARGGKWIPGKGYVKSLISAIGDLIDAHMREIGFIAGGPLMTKAEKAAQLDAAEAAGAVAPAAEMPVPDLGRRKVQREGCKDYGNCDIIKTDGCERCLTCSWSRCG